MIPIPPPDRLIPRPTPPSRGGGGRHSLGEGLLLLGALPLIFGGAIAAGAIAGALWSWLAIPGGIIGMGVAIGLFGNPTVVSGIIQAAIYSGITFIAMDGRERTDPTPAWIAASVVAALFLWATYSSWKKNR